MDKAIRIRPVGADDIEAAVTLSRALHMESPRWGRYAFSEAKSRAVIDYFIKNGGGFVADAGGEIIGMAGAVVTEAFFSTEKYAVDMVLYVIPAWRGSSAFIKLARVMERWMAAQPIKDMVLSVSTEIETDRTVKLYERLGYVVNSFSLIKKVV